MNKMFLTAFLSFLVAAIVGIGQLSAQIESSPNIDQALPVSLEGGLVFPDRNTISVLGQKIALSPETIQFTIIFSAFVVVVAIILSIIFLFISILKTYRNIARDRIFANAWNTYKKQIRSFSFITIVSIIITNFHLLLTLIFSMPLRITEPLTLSLLDLSSINVYSVSIYLVSYIFGSLSVIGFIFAAVNAAENKSTTLLTYFIGMKYITQYIVGLIIYSFAVIIGLVLFIVPGIYIALRFYYWPYCIADKISILQAFRLSSKLTRNIKWELFLFLFLLHFLNIAGILVFGIGLVISLPFTAIASALLYVALKQNSPATLG